MRKFLAAAMIGLATVCTAQTHRGEIDEAVSALAYVRAVLSLEGFGACQSTGWPDTPYCDAIARSSMKVMGDNRAKYGGSK